jgi:hypothetical protein
MGASVDKRGADPIKPRPAVFIVERRSARHFGARFRRMKIVAVDKFDLADFRETQADRRLAAAGDAHDNQREPVERIL